MYVGALRWLGIKSKKLCNIKHILHNWVLRQSRALCSAKNTFIHLRKYTTYIIRGSVRAWCVDSSKAGHASKMCFMWKMYTSFFLAKYNSWAHATKNGEWILLLKANIFSSLSDIKNSIYGDYPGTCRCRNAKYADIEDGNNNNSDRVNWIVVPEVNLRNIGHGDGATIIAVVSNTRNF